MKTPHRSPLKIAFIGSGGLFSNLPLRDLLASGADLVLVGVDGISRPLTTDPRLRVQLPQHETVEALARQQQIPLYDLQQGINGFGAAMKRAATDLLIVACYARRLPQAVLDIPTIACVNLHPSLLPAYRGPAPLFWQFRHGRNEFGITLHRMDGEFDSGPIIAQQQVPLADGTDHHQANRLLATGGSRLIANYLRAIEKGQVTERIQNPEQSTYWGHPAAEDFQVSDRWPARRLFNFIVGTRHWGMSYPCKTGDGCILLSDAVSFAGHASSQPYDHPSGNGNDGDLVTISCRPGILLARPASRPNGTVPAE